MPPDLRSKAYWDDLYRDELEQWNENKVEPDEWYLPDTAAVLKFTNKIISPLGLDASILDLGCGGGVGIARLLRLGYTNITGCDYSAHAISLAYNFLLRPEKLHIARSVELPRRPRRVQLVQIDLNDPCQVLAEAYNQIHRATAAAEDESHTAAPHEAAENDLLVQVVQPGGADWSDTFDAVVDKGTFDVFFMRQEVDIYVQRVAQLMKPHGVLVLTSGNCTPSELGAILQPTPYGQFELIEFAPPAATITFGGSSGQRTTTAAYRFGE